MEFSSPAFGLQRDADVELGRLLEEVAEGGDEAARVAVFSVLEEAGAGNVVAAHEEFAWLTSCPGIAGSSRPELLVRAAGALCLDDEELCSVVAARIAGSRRVGRLGEDQWVIGGVSVAAEDGWLCVDGVRAMCRELVRSGERAAALEQGLAAMGRRSGAGVVALESVLCGLLDRTMVVCLVDGYRSAEVLGEAVWVRFAPWSLAWRAGASRRWGAVLPRCLAEGVGEVAGVAEPGDEEAAVLAAELWAPRASGPLRSPVGALESARAVLAAHA